MLFLCRELADPRHSVLFIFWYSQTTIVVSIFLLTPFLLYRRKLFVGHWQMNFLKSEVTMITKITATSIVISNCTYRWSLSAINKHCEVSKALISKS